MSMLRVASFGLFLTFATSVAFGQTAKSQQSPARPYGLQPYALVMKQGSDSRAADFNANVRSTAYNMVQSVLPEGQVYKDASKKALQPDKLYLVMDTVRKIRVYFIDEGAGYHNSLTFSLSKANTFPPQVRSSGLVFPDSSYESPSYLVSGDFVDIDYGRAGEQLDFFIIANGANSPIATYTNRKNADGSWANPDGLVHAVALDLEGTPYYMIGFEDLWQGGDKDYNDLSFVVDVGMENKLSNLPH